MMFHHKFGLVDSYVFDVTRNDATWQKITRKDLYPQAQKKMRESIWLQLCDHSQQQVNEKQCVNFLFVARNQCVNFLAIFKNRSD